MSSGKSLVFFVCIALHWSAGKCKNSNNDDNEGDDNDDDMMVMVITTGTS